MQKMLIIIVNCIISINVFVIATIGIISGAGDGQVGNYIVGTGYFKPFTMDSNILAGILALITVIYRIRDRHYDGNQIPKWLMSAYLMGTTCLVLTFFIAAAFLAPAQAISGRSYWIMFGKDMFFFHFLNPVLSTITFIFLLGNIQLSRKDRLIGMIPTVLYSVVYFVMVVVLKRWEDFYNFTFGGKYYLVPVVIIVIYLLSYMISCLLIWLHNLNLGKYSDKG